MKFPLMVFLNNFIVKESMHEISIENIHRDILYILRIPNKNDFHLKQFQVTHQANPSPPFFSAFHFQCLFVTWCWTLRRGGGAGGRCSFSDKKWPEMTWCRLEPDEVFFLLFFLLWFFVLRLWICESIVQKKILIRNVWLDAPFLLVESESYM